MTLIDQKIGAWGGPFCAVFLGAGLLIAGFVPPPAPTLSAAEIALLYQTKATAIRAGMILALVGFAGYTALVGAISAQLRRLQGPSRMPQYLQTGAGSIGILTVMFPAMIFAVAAFRPERDPALTQLLNDAGWLIIIPAFPTFVAQFGAIAAGIFQDRSAAPVFPRWIAYFNLWIGLLFLPGALSYFFRTGPFAWNGLIAFWLAASAFFAWLIVMSVALLSAIRQQERHPELVPVPAA